MNGRGSSGSSGAPPPRGGSGANLGSTVLGSSPSQPEELPWVDTAVRADRSQGPTDGRKAESEELATGTWLSSELRVVKRLGKGGQGDVYEVEDRVGRRFAVKLLLDAIAEDRTFVARLRREAETVRGIDHPNVIRVHGLETTDSGRSFVWMELLVGKPLDALIREESPLPIDRATALAVGIARGLAAVHQLGIVHRDLKPANVFIVPGPDRSEVPKIMDFGIAKAGGGVDATKLTQTGSILGTPSYMSPEQILSPAETDARSDQYSFGVLLFQLLTGRLPFASEQVAQLLMQHVRTPPPNPRTLRDDVPQAIAAIALRAMSKTAEERFASMNEVAAKLEAARTLPTTRPKVLGGEAPRGGDVAPRWQPGQGAWAPEGGATPRAASKTRGPSAAPEPPPLRPVTIVQQEAPSHFGRNVALVLALAAGVVGVRIWLNQRDVEEEDEAEEAHAEEIRPAPAPSFEAPRVGRLRVDSEPAGARIFLDGAPTTYSTPAEIVNQQVGKPIAVSVEKHGTKPEPARALVTIPGDTMAAAIRFHLAPTKLIPLTSKPAGARVSIDGRRLPGVTPLELPPMAPGETTRVTVELDGFAPATLDVAAEQTSALVELKPARAMEILSTPSGAEVKVDGVAIGNTPLFSALVPDKQAVAIEISVEGYLPYRTKLGATDKRRQIEVELKPKSTPGAGGVGERVAKLEARIAELDERIRLERREMEAAEEVAEREARTNSHEVSRRVRAQNAFDEAKTRYKRSVAKRDELAHQLEELKEE
ncbi:MAG: serine/threonine protein kinase [Deltaproteobacteria bacterium]|nr:serine/threonine protein kinase [Deltaproteobacteria bacterium]